MIIIILENTKRGEWEIKNKKDDILCVQHHESEEDAIAWCNNYMSSFQVNYKIEIIKFKGQKNGLYS